jgi:hypothetical protein
MNSRLGFCLLVFSVGIFSATAWRLYTIYRRRRRWKLLTTSHQSLHIARARIVRNPQSPEEE